MKTNAIIRIIAWSLVIVVLLGVLFVFTLGKSFFLKGIVLGSSPEASKAAVSLEEAAMHVNAPGESIEIDADQIRDLNIVWAAGKILIQPADVPSIEISETEVEDAKHAMLWKVSGNKLTIRFQEDTTLGFGINIGDALNKDLTILVPKDWKCGTLEIDAAAADLEVSGLEIKEVEFDGASGVCEFNNCVVDQLDLDTASGNVTFTGSLDVLDCDAASANVIAVLENIPSRIDMDSMSGDLDLTLPENAGFTVTMDGMSSEFDSDFETSIKNGKYVCGDGSCRISVDGMSGDVIIRKG